MKLTIFLVNDWCYFINKKRKRLGFAIKGHANFDQHGYDIVCAAVSILSYTAVNTLDYYEIDFDFFDDENEMKVSLKIQMKNLKLF